MITATSSKSCQLDPVLTTVVKEFLLEIHPFITEMCIASLGESSIPLSQRHAIIAPRLKKTNANPSEDKNYLPI